MRRRAIIVAWVLLTVMLLAPCALAAGEVSEIRLNQVQQQQDGSITMYVNLNDGSGNLVSGSTKPSQYTVFVDDEGYDVDGVQLFDPKTMGINYVLCFDVSGSAVNLMPNVQQGLCAFIDALGPKDTVSLLTFGTQVSELTRLNTNREQLKILISSTKADQNDTALYKGVLDGMEIARTLSGQRSAVVVLTDGKNDVANLDASMQQYTKDSIFEQVREAQMPLYCIGMTDGDPRYGDPDMQSLKELADATGGRQFEIASPQVGVSLQSISNIMRSAAVLHVSLVNKDGKKALTTSKIRVGYAPEGASWRYSNILEQQINWQMVPEPVYTPAPTVVPALDLDLDETEIAYADDGDVKISGVIEMKQGSVAKEDLTIIVNGELWQATLNPNGADYTFEASGVISESTSTLEVCAGIRESDIQSRIQRIEVLTPTPVPTLAPVKLRVTLDESNVEPMLLPGEVLPISGVIEAEGDVNPDNLMLVINQQEYEIDLKSLGGGEYEFAVEYPMQSDAELNISVKLSDSEIESRKQRLYLAQPTPTPAPELTLSLDDDSIEYDVGATATVRGSVAISSGEVSADDIEIYVMGALWGANVTQRDDGSYHFEATKEMVDGDITQMDVKAKLRDSNVVSNVEQLALYTPEPVVTPSPTPKPVRTMKPTEEPVKEVATPEPESTPEAPWLQQTVNALVASGKIWYVAAGGGLLLILIIVLIVVLVLKRKRKPKIEPVSESFNTENREDDPSLGKTIRGEQEGDGDATLRDDDGGHADSGFIGEDLHSSRQGTLNLGGEDTGGTIYLGGEDMSGTIRLDGENEMGGTIRLDDGDETGGTMRIEDEGPSIEVTMEESCKNRERGTRSVRLTCDEEIVLGRSDSADMVIDDETVSSRHAMLIFDGENVYIEDLGSTNGTKINKERERLASGERRKLQEGDTVTVGKTTLKFHIGEPEMG